MNPTPLGWPGLEIAEASAGIGVDYMNIRREIRVSKSVRLILGGKFNVSKSIGLAYSWKEIFVSNLQEVFY